MALWLNLIIQLLSSDEDPLRYTEFDQDEDSLYAGRNHLDSVCIAKQGCVVVSLVGSVLNLRFWYGPLLLELFHVLS